MVAAYALRQGSCHDASLHRVAVVGRRVIGTGISLTPSLRGGGSGGSSAAGAAPRRAERAREGVWCGFRASSLRWGGGRGRALEGGFRAGLGSGWSSGPVAPRVLPRVAGARRPRAPRSPGSGSLGAVGAARAAGPLGWPPGASTVPTPGRPAGRAGGFGVGEGRRRVLGRPGAPGRVPRGGRVGRSAQAGRGGRDQRRPLRGARGRERGSGVGQETHAKHSTSGEHSS